MSRGYAAIGLWKPKDKANIGSALRAAQCYDAKLVVIEWNNGIKASTDTMKAWRHMPVIRTKNHELWEHLPYDCVPIAVEITDDAESLVTFEHPERAFYVFGPENGSLSPSAIGRCAHTVMVPTRFCMNLAATVNVVLYDRLAKQPPARPGPAGAGEEGP